jgi:integrase
MTTTSTTTKKTRRRGAGEGSVYFDETKKLFVASVELGRDENGKRVRKVVKAKSKADVLRKLRAQQGHVDKGVPVPDARSTTRQWLDFWLADVLPGTVSESTETVYRNVLTYYVIPHVGQVPLAKLSPDHVQRMMRTVEASGRAPATVSAARRVLRRSLADAERFEKVQRNVAGLTRAPKKARMKLDDALDAAQAAQVLETARGDRLEALAVLVLAVGCRQGEALALRWGNVDLGNATMYVADAKTAAGVRTIALPDFVVDALKAHKARQREERIAAPVWADNDLVFTSTIGTQIDSRNALRWWHDLTIAAGVGRRRFHASRHTAATLMLNNGVALEVVSKTLGHAGLTITADVYAKVGAKLQRTAADTMQEVLGR